MSMIRIARVFKSGTNFRKTDVMTDLLPQPEIMDIVRLRWPLVNMAASLARGDHIKIVAIGSSSTRGAGGTAPYPYLLWNALRERYPGRQIEVLNKGVDGEEAADEFKRFERDVVAEQPTMVIWQVGTNAAWKGYDLDDVEEAVRTGVARLKELSADIVLMDPQYTTAMIDPATIAASIDMTARIAKIARQPNVNVFRRFALMRFWNVVWQRSVTELTEPNGKLHQSDLSYRGLALALDRVIAEAPTIRA